MNRFTASTAKFLLCDDAVIFNSPVWILWKFKVSSVASLTGMQTAAAAAAWKLHLHWKSLKAFLLALSF